MELGVPAYLVKLKYNLSDGNNINEKVLIYQEFLFEYIGTYKQTQQNADNICLRMPRRPKFDWTGLVVFTSSL